LGEEYVSDEEYPTYFTRLRGLRRRVAASLPLEHGMKILDIATGSAYFAMELARLDESLRITGIDISEGSFEAAKENISKNNLEGRVEVRMMDASRLRFPYSSFDMAVNFLGLEDIHMTKGLKGLRGTFRGVGRVVKQGGHFSFVVMPPEEAETPAQRLEVEVFSRVLGATWLSADEYLELLGDAGFSLVRREAFHTGMKLTPGQAREEIRFACEEAPKIFGVKTISFEEAWSIFGDEIEREGLGHYSRVVLMIAKKE
jgi:ubiquinone/menaquinone biosynthesis C-methylase UbiE